MSCQSPEKEVMINGSSFSLGEGGTTTLRLGYVASYIISLPQSVSLSNGLRLVFVRC